MVGISLFCDLKRFKGMQQQSIGWLEALDDVIARHLEIAVLTLVGRDLRVSVRVKDSRVLAE